MSVKRHDFQAVFLDRGDVFFVSRFRFVRHVEKNVNTWSVDVDVDETHFRPLFLQGQGEVDAHGRFPHAAFRGRDGYDVLDALDAYGPFLRGVRLRGLFDRFFPRVFQSFDHYHDTGHLAVRRACFNGAAAFILHPPFGLLVVGGQAERQYYRFAVHDYSFDPVVLDDVAFTGNVSDRSQRRFDSFFVQSH